MVFRISEKVNVRIASGNLALRLLSKRISSRISSALFLYILTLPLDAQVPKNISSVILFVGTLCSTHLLFGNYQASVDRWITWTIYFGLKLGIGSVLGSFWPMQWIIQLVSTTKTLVLCGLFVAVLCALYRTRKLISLIIPLTEFLFDMFTLWLRFVFFLAQDTIYENLDFLAALGVQYVITLIQYVAIHMVLSVITKLIWGSFWFNYKFFLLALFCLWVRNTKDIWDNNDYYLWGTPEESTRTHERYIYTPLPTSRHVRLLLMYPRHPDASIRCTLISVSLEHSPYFEAVSYTVRSFNFSIRHEFKI
jgi:hypothetical protein